MSTALRPCPACSAKVSAEHRFCPECGHDTTGPVRADSEPVRPDAAPLPGAPAGPASFVPGRVIDKVYRLVERIGVGGMGSVWRAEHVLLKRPCAVKLMAPEFTGGVRFREKFIQEGSVLAGLDHPGIVHCTHAGVSEEGQLYLVMELAAGLTLRQILKSEGRLALGPALAIARGILDAADYAHANRVVHRDLKPENVLVDGWGTNRLRVKVLDFGIAKVVEESADVGGPAGASRTYAGWGTLPYMSPEQAAGDPVDHQTDVYAVGAMTYEMLAGRAPIEAETQRKLLWKVANEVPEGLRKARPDVPAGVEAAVMAALAKEAGDRPASAAALRAAFGEPSGRPAAAPGGMSGGALPSARGAGVQPVPMAGAAADQTRPWRIAAIMAGVLALALVTALVWPKHRAPDPQTAGGNYTTAPEVVPAAGNRAIDPHTSATRYRLTLVADPLAGGTIRCLTPGDDFEDGAEVTILATPTSPGYEFAGWADAPSEKLKRTWYMQPGGNELIASFRRVRHRVQATVFPKDAGTVEPDDTQVNHGDLLTLVARESNAAYRFAHWRGSTNTTARLELRVTEPTTVVAEFELARHALTVLSEPTNGGTVTAKPPGPEHEHGAEVTLEAIPAAGWRFKGWQGTPAAQVDAILHVQVTGPASYTALFERKPTEEIAQQVLALLEPLGINQQGRPEFRHEATGIVLVLIPAGEFWMGSPDDEPYRDGDERRHRVHLTKAFLMGKYEVTNDQFRKHFHASHDSGELQALNAGLQPVVIVNWLDATDFCETLGFRLPTEAEWERAARGGGEKNVFPWGKDWPPPAKSGNFGDTTGHNEWRAKDPASELPASYDDGFASTSPIGTFSPNGYGLHDLAGNAWEWCGDLYDDYPDASVGVAVDPTGPGTGVERVLRGGPWSCSSREFLRCADRFSFVPDLGTTRFGFRVVLATGIDRGTPVPAAAEMERVVPMPEAAVRAGLDANCIMPPGDKDAHGNAVVTRNGSRTDGKTGLPFEVWLHLPGGPLELVLVPAGEFDMGAPAGRGDSDEHPRHLVRITKPFYLAKYEVTQAQWRAVMGNNPSFFEGAGATAPVEGVSWGDCRGFLEKTGLRLPTEAEWEYACQAGGSYRLRSGEPEWDYARPAQQTSLDEIAWYVGNGEKTTHPVGKKQRNAWGLYDMSGNVWEWCEDVYDSDYYLKAIRWSNKYAQSSASCTSGSPDRVIRGGAWNFPEGYCRSANRDRRLPGFSGNYLGFRPAKQLR